MGFDEYEALEAANEPFLVDNDKVGDKARDQKGFLLRWFFYESVPWLMGPIIISVLLLYLFIPGMVKYDQGDD